MTVDNKYTPNTSAKKYTIISEGIFYSKAIPINELKRLTKFNENDRTLLIIK